MTGNEMKKILLLGAMPQEVEAYNIRLNSKLWRQYDIKVDTTGVGKVAAASVTQRYISDYNPDFIIFTGVAGSLSEELCIGDVGVCVYGIDADLDTRTWNPDMLRGEQPFTGNRLFQSSKKLLELVENVDFFGFVATGSAFLDFEGKKQFIRNVVPDLEAEIEGGQICPNLYDMESSAVMQVANNCGVPVLVVRAISDTTKGDSASDFNAFVEGAVGDYLGLVDKILEGLNE